MHGDRQPLAGLLLNDADRANPIVFPAHAVDIGTPLPREKHQREGETLLRPDWLARLEARDLLVGPCANLADLGPLEAKRRIVLQPTALDRMADEDA